MDQLFEHAKAYLAVIFGFVVYAATRIAAEHPVLPDVDPFDVRGWLLLVAGLVGGYLTVSRTPNITRDPVKAQTESMVYRPKKVKTPPVVVNNGPVGSARGRDVQLPDDPEPQGP
jgi:hypothetical protein